jgi:hypothetical protein
MSERRTGYAGGIAWALLSIGAGTLLPQPPAADADAATVLAYFGDNQNHIVIASAISAIAALLLAPYFVSLASRFVDPAAAHVARVVGAVVVTTGLLGGVLQVGLARSAPSLGASTTLLSAYMLDRAVFFITPPMAISVVLAAAFVGLRRPSAPRWIGLSAGAVGLVAFAGGVAGLLSAAKSVTNIGFGGFLLTIGWVGGTSIALWLSSGARRAVPVQDVSAASA